MTMAKNVPALRDQVRDQLEDKDAAERLGLARRLAEPLARSGLAPAERLAAEELARQLAQDAAEMVRMALAEAVKNYSFLPRDVALRIAHDIDSVACPFLEATEVFSEEDWQQLVLTVSPAARVAVARREHLSEGLVTVLAQVGEAEVAETLVANDNAPLAAPACATLMERFPDRPTVLERMARRSQLPAEIVVELVSKVSEAARETLAKRYDMEDFTAPVAAEARSATLLRMVGNTPPQDLRAFAETLHRRGELDPLFLLRALDGGFLAFFEAGMAVRAGLPVDNARALIRQGGDEAIAKLCDKARIPAALRDDVRRAIAGAVSA